MPETLGFALADIALAAADGAIDGEVAGAFLTSTTLGVSNASLIGSAALIGATVGVSTPLHPRKRKVRDDFDHHD